MLWMALAQVARAASVQAALDVVVESPSDVTEAPTSRLSLALSCGDASSPRLSWEGAQAYYREPFEADGSLVEVPGLSFGSGFVDQASTVVTSEVSTVGGALIFARATGVSCTDLDASSGEDRVDSLDSETVRLAVAFLNPSFATGDVLSGFTSWPTDELPVGVPLTMSAQISAHPFGFDTLRFQLRGTEGDQEIGVMTPDDQSPSSVDGTNSLAFLDAFTLTEPGSWSIVAHFDLTRTSSLPLELTAVDGPVDVGDTDTGDTDEASTDDPKAEGCGGGCDQGGGVGAAPLLLAGVWRRRSGRAQRAG